MDTRNTRKSRASIENLEFRFGSSSSQTSQTSGDFCRICHESDNISPLIKPCLCSGTLRFVHQTCLTQWLTASETNSCELCKFNFIMQSKIKPFNEWRSLEMSGVERRRLFCAVLFHLAAALCVIWSLCVLIERSAEEVAAGKLSWPFWTKLVVVTVGMTGGVAFMYIQCKQYINLCSRWRARNRILLIQNAPEKNSTNQPQSPLPFQNSHPSGSILVITAPLNVNMGHSDLHQQSQIVANIENSSINYELDDDGFSQISFKHRQDEGNSSRGSLHNVYDNTSISTTNTSARNKDLADNDSNFLKMMTGGLQEVQEAEDVDDKRIRPSEKNHTSMFIENSDILSSTLYYHRQHSLLPSTANSRSIDDPKQKERRRYSLGEAKMLQNGCLHFENETLVKTLSQEEKLRNELQENFGDLIFDQLEMSIQNILELDKNEQKNHQISLETNMSEKKESKKNIFQSLPNLEVP